MTDAAQDAIKKALGAAYSASINGAPKSEILAQLRAVLASNGVRPLIPDYLADLEAVVAARSVGDRCGCYVSQTQLRLLKEALAP